MEGNGDELAWVDTETTGLDAKKHRVIEIAIVITDAELVEKDAFESKIWLSPEDRLIAEPIALEVNKYNEEEWKDAPKSSRELWKKVFEMTRGRNFSGQNPEFDTNFVAAEMFRYGITRTGWFRRLLDTQPFGQIVGRQHNLRTAKGAITNSLIPIYNALGGPPLPEHRAMGDIRRAIYIYDTFRKLYADAVVSKAKDLVGEAAAAALSQGGG